MKNVSKIVQMVHHNVHFAHDVIVLLEVFFPNIKLEH